MTFQRPGGCSATSCSVEAPAEGEAVVAQGWSWVLLFVDHPDIRPDTRCWLTPNGKATPKLPIVPLLCLTGELEGKSK